LQKTGKVAEEEMFRVFNCGIGMVIVLAREHLNDAKALLEREGEGVYDIGRIEATSGEPEALVV
jgi:phosphoribosylformylglycinamidine cyclo-ligase